MAQISIRMDDELRKKTEEILSELGLNMSAAVNILARQVVRMRGLPFPLMLSDEHASTRPRTARKLFEYADAHPAKLPNDYKFNREECYDE
jgi:DNA-damage-inducible protein J